MQKVVISPRRKKGNSFGTSKYAKRLPRLHPDDFFLGEDLNTIERRKELLRMIAEGRQLKEIYGKQWRMGESSLRLLRCWNGAKNTIHLVAMAIKRNVI